METNSKHGLTPKNLKKIMYIAKFIDILILKIIRIDCIGLFSAFYGGYLAVAYIKQEFSIYLISIIIWFLILSFWVIKVTAIICFSYSILFFNIYYLILRFKQLYNPGILKVHNLRQVLFQHTKLTMMTDESNQLFKYLMAYSYFVYTLVVILTFLIFQYGKGVFLLRLANQTVGCFGVCLVFLITLFSARLSQEAHRFYKTMNSYLISSNLDLNFKIRVYFR